MGFGHCDFHFPPFRERKILRKAEGESEKLSKGLSSCFDSEIFNSDLFRVFCFCSIIVVSFRFLVVLQQALYLVFLFVRKIS